MNKFKLFVYFLIQTPVIIFFIFLNIFSISLLIKLSYIPTGTFLDLVYDQVPWWLKNFSIIDLILTNVYFIYKKFNEWVKVQGF